MRLLLYSAFFAFLISASGCEAEQGALEDTLPDVYTLTTEASPDTGGSISPSQGEYITGQSIQIEARPSEGYIFDYWEGDLSGNKNPEELIFSENRSVTAHFTERDYDLNIAIEGEGSVRETVIERSAFVIVSLAAEADSGWVFDRWEGDLTGSENPETITIEDDEKAVTAVFVEDVVGEHTLSIKVEGEGSASKDPNLTSYTDGEEVELTAQPASGWSFSKWEGALSGRNNPGTLVMDKDKSVTAVFVEDPAGEYILSVMVEGEGSVSKDPNRSSYTDGDEVELTAQPASGWRFSKWKGALSGRNNPGTLVMDQDKSVTAIFVEDISEEYTLSVTVDGEGSVAKNPKKNSYTDGEEVALTAQPALGWSFSKWEGALSGSTNPGTVIMDEDKSVTAVFVEDVPEKYTLSVSVDGEGSVSKDPNRSSYTDGDEVELTAQPAPGWSFSEWKGALSGSNNPGTVVMDQNKNVTAVFEQDIVMEVVVDEVKLFIKEMKMDGARRTKDFNTSNFVLNLPLDGTRFMIKHTEISTGFYDELELEIEKPEKNEDEGYPDFKDGSNRYSLVVKGAYSGEQFIFRSTEDFEISVDMNPHLEIAEEQNAVIAIDIDFEGWFRNSIGEILDPSESRNRKQINENIEDSFSDFEDEY